MDWLNGWLKQIILVILLATFVDLVLPNNVMQRYVKAVIGLFILLTILAPVTALFKEKLDINEEVLDMELMGKGRVSISAQTVSGGQMSSLSSIVQEGGRLKAENEQKSLEFVENRMEAMVKEKVEQTFNQPVDQVQVKTELDEQGKPRIQSMRVVLKKADSPSDEGRSREDGGMQPVRPIEPVSIHIEVGKEAGRPIGSVPQPISSDMEKVRGQVIDQLKQDWQISSKQLLVLYDIENNK